MADAAVRCICKSSPVAQVLARGRFHLDCQRAASGLHVVYPFIEFTRPPHAQLMRRLAEPLQLELTVRRREHGRAHLQRLVIRRHHHARHRAALRVRHPAMDPRLRAGLDSLQLDKMPAVLGLPVAVAREYPPQLLAPGNVVKNLDERLAHIGLFRGQLAPRLPKPPVQRLLRGRQLRHSRIDPCLMILAGIRVRRRLRVDLLQQLGQRGVAGTGFLGEGRGAGQAGEGERRRNKGDTEFDSEFLHRSDFSLVTT